MPCVVSRVTATEGDTAMLFIWGWRARYKTLSSGTFYCPSEGGDRPYRHQRAQRWFTVFFLPVIPLKVLGEFIECGSCGAAYDTAVLTMPTAAKMMDNLANAMRYAVVAIAAADGQVLDSEKEAALTLMRRYSDTPYTREDLERDLRELHPDSLEDAFTQVAGTLNEHGKEDLVTACLALAAADGDVDESEVKEIAKAASALGMSPAHLRGILSGAPERRSD